MGFQYKHVYVIKQSWTGEHDSVNVWWSYDSQNPTTRQKRKKKKDPNKLSSISTKKKREPESEKVLRESQKKGRDTEQISPSNKHWSLTSFSEQGETEEGKTGKHRKQASEHRKK